MTFSFQSVQPINGFCSWGIRVKGIDHVTQKLADEELSKYVLTLTVESSKSNFGLVSNTYKEFQFGGSGSADSWTYDTLTLAKAALLDIHIIAAQPGSFEKFNFDVTITATIKDVTAMKAGGIIAIILTIIIVSAVIAGLLLQAMGKVDFVKRCRPKPPTEIELQQIAEMETMRAAIEESVLQKEEKLKIQDKITHQGQNDSFFAGEEMIDQEEINPNVSMGYQKFRFDPNPEFIE